MAVVFATNATKVVLAGANALDPGSASPDAWYFKLPPQASEFKIRANDPALVELKDPDGRVYPLPGGEGKYRVVNELKGLAPFVSVEVPPGTRKGFCSIRALNSGSRPPGAPPCCRSTSGGRCFAWTVDPAKGSW